ncbi:hypothetical protein [Devosia naphthalenivorans]|uniref:hypothetical protein n=1 Tax=Devosia naphthalenivorans TaxID=2082392 RepID=UPI000D3714B8|nr:hypothetical protein [Devosia naphthalenivorans]
MEDVWDKSKRFGLNSYRDLLAKLDWEIEGLEDVVENSIEERYRYFNTAVTAWHLTDWVWQAMSAEDRRIIVDQHPASRDTVTSFQKLVRLTSEALLICDQVANGSKHFERSRHDNPDIFTAMTNAMNIYQHIETGELMQKETVSTFIVYGDSFYAPIALFRKARSDWDLILNGFGLS